MEPGCAAGLTVELSLLPLASVRKKWIREIQGNRGRDLENDWARDRTGDNSKSFQPIPLIPKGSLKLKH